MLEVRNLNVNYGYLRVLSDINLKVNEGEIVCVLGPNGSGKTTLIASIAGLISPKQRSGTIIFQNTRIDRLPPYDIARLGISCITDKTGIFPEMTVLENLLVGGLTLKKNERNEALKQVFALFPVLRERCKQLAGTLSGGERKMLLIGRALMSKAKLLLLDEVSAGLAPIVLGEILRRISEIARTGKSILLVEQNVFAALSVSNRGYVIENGRIIIEDTCERMLKNDIIKSAYLGIQNCQAIFGDWKR